MRGRDRGKFKVAGALERLDDRITPATFGNLSTYASPFMQVSFGTGGGATTGTSLIGTTPTGGVFGGTAFSGGAAAFGGNTFGAQSALGGLYGTSGLTYTNANAGGRVVSFGSTGGFNSFSNPFATSGSSLFGRTAGTTLGTTTGTTTGTATVGTTGTTSAFRSFTPVLFGTGSGGQSLGFGALSGTNGTGFSYGYTPGQSTVITGGGALSSGLTSISNPSSTFLSFISPFTNASQFGYVNNVATGNGTGSTAVSTATPGIGYNGTRYGLLGNGLINNGSPFSSMLGSSVRFGFTNTGNTANALGFNTAGGQYLGLSYSNSGVGAGGGVI